MIKKSIFLLFIYFSFSQCYAQISLTYAKHALKEGELQHMLKADYVEAGPAGAGQIWDFAKLNFYGEEVTRVIQASECPKYGLIPSANLSTVTDNGFYGMYNITNTSNDNWGYMGDNYHVIFSQPHRRMVYPFTYGNYYAATYFAQGFYPKELTTDIAGDYNFEADAFGTLVLPNSILTNVLRVRTEVHKYEFMQCFFSETHQVKYLYYTSQERYPVFAILETMWVNNNGKDTSYHRSSAINKAVTNNPNFELVEIGQTTNKGTTPELIEVGQSEVPDYKYLVSPNPFADEFEINFVLDQPQKVSVELYNMHGVKIDDIISKRSLEAGFHKHTHNAGRLPNATYFVKFTFDNSTFIEPIIKVN